ncbi:MAG: S-layer homology domain-containing protein, partial [Tissierellia bacterium]|nr:S-layer homology domain-containing protein [Tissierellia bacterium]
IPIATGSEKVAAEPFNQASLPDFGTRHLALWEKGGPIYDILGIPSCITNSTVTFENEGTTHATVKVVTGETINGDDLTDESMPKNPTREGYTFKGWNTQADGQGETFTGDSTVSADMTVYAIWEKDTSTSTSTVTFKNEDATHATVKVETGKTINNDDLTDESMPKNPTREGYTFKGWNTQADGKGDWFTGDSKVSGDMTVYAIWEEKPSSGGGTSGGGHAFIPGIPPALNTKDHYQYMTGYPDETFRPDRDITREEVAVMFSRLLTQRPEKNKIYDYDFNDIAPSRWSITPVSYMSHLGMIKGYPDGSFGPAKSITRAEFAAMATRFAELTTGDAKFNDVGTDHWAYEAIAKAATAGWISGYPDGSFKPDQAITRAEVVSVTNRILNRYADEKYVAEHSEEIMYFSDNKPQHWAYYAVIESTNGHEYQRKDNGKDEKWLETNDKSFID